MESSATSHRAEKDVGTIDVTDDALPSVRDDSTCRRLLTLADDGIACVPLVVEARFRRRYRDIPLHAHAGRVEITTCLRGNIEYECEGRPYRFRPGDVFVVAPGLFHRPLSYPKGLHRYRLLFQPPRRGRAILGLAKAESDWLVDGILSLGVQQFADGGDVRSGFQKVVQLVDVLPANSAERRLKLRVAVADLLLAIIAAAKAPPRILPANRVKQLVDEMRDHPERNYAMDSLSARLQMSPTALQLRFKHLTGLPPHAFLTECRMDMARRLIREGRPIEVVANSLGYASAKHFSGIFRRFVGCAPSRWTE